MIYQANFEWFDPGRIELREDEPELKGIDLGQLGAEICVWPGYHQSIWLSEGHVGQILACGGVHKLSCVRGEAWVILDRRAEKYTKTVYQYIRSVLWVGVRTLRLTRIEANVHESHPKARTLMKHLGFRYESLKPKYFHDGGASLHYVYFPKALT